MARCVPLYAALDAVTAAHSALVLVSAVLKPKRVNHVVTDYLRALE